MKNKRLLYRLLMFVLGVAAGVCGYAAQMAHAIDSFYFPSHPHPASDSVGPYVLYVVGALLLIEGVFLFALRRFTVPPNHALQRTEAGGGVGSEFDA